MVASMNKEQEDPLLKEDLSSIMLTKPKSCLCLMFLKRGASINTDSFTELRQSKNLAPPLCFTQHELLLVRTMQMKAGSFSGL